jgi:phosphoribosylformylglycinamidine synthase subunit PurQ / glutaminase
VRFPGSNCDDDAFYAIGAVLGQPVEFIWHQSEDLAGSDVVILPGGFAFGDYLRTGAIARFSAVMKAVDRFARSGGLVLGICNGFQILCESGLLPGALMRNSGLKYICKQVHLRTETTDSPFTNVLRKWQVLQIPIGHMEGNYFCDELTLAALNREDRIAFRYATPSGDITANANPNGSLDNIAGVLNEGRNVLGMMPHPDRSSESLLGSADGFPIFQSMIAALGGLADPDRIGALSKVTAGAGS